MILPDVLLRWCAGDEDAARFCALAWEAAQVWDDIHDADRRDGRDALIAWFAFGKECDPFFRAHASELRPVMLSVYLQWQAANALEREPSRGALERSFMLRAGIFGLIHVVAWLTGGHDHAVSVGAEIYRAYGESLDGLCIEMGVANA